MIQTYSTAENRLRPGSRAAAPDLTATWIDLVNPEPEEVKPLNDRFAISIPDRADMEEIEISSRLYRENGAAFMMTCPPKLPSV